MICKICNSEFNTLQGLSNHLFYKHKIEKSDYYLKYINNNCYCKVCGNKTKFLDLKRGFKSICENKECFLAYTNPRRKSFWILRGFNDIEAEQKVSEVQSKSVKNRTKDSYTGKHNSLCIDYYLNKGYTKEEAIELISKRQNVSSKDSFINRYGDIEGIKRYEQRIQLFKETNASKSIDEKIKINKSKANGREQLIKKYGHTVAENIIKSRLVSKYNKTYNIACSKLELEIFNYLKNKFPEIKQQLCLTESGNIFYYDMFINNIIIEYNGTYWHADPRKYKATDKIRNKTAEECWMKDKFKQNLANKNGYIIFYIWESDYVKNKMHILNEITNKIYAFINN